MNPQTNDVYIYSSHDKKKGVYLIDTLEDQNPSPSPSTSEAQLKKISEELLTLHIHLGHQGVEAMHHAMKTKALLNVPDEKVDKAIRKCEICQRAKSKKKEKGKKSKEPEDILQQICVVWRRPPEMACQRRTGFRCKRNKGIYYQKFRCNQEWGVDTEMTQEWHLL